jgi:hypothetical protein
VTGKLPVAFMNPALSISAAAPSGERKATDTNFAARRPAASCFLGRVLTAGDGSALPSRTSLAQVRGRTGLFKVGPVLWFQRLRNAAVAPELAGRIIVARPSTQRAADNVSAVQLPPKPAQFFLCPRRPHHAANSRGLPLVWLLTLNQQLRRAA